VQPAPSRRAPAQHGQPPARDPLAALRLPPYNGPIPRPKSPGFLLPPPPVTRARAGARARRPGHAAVRRFPDPNRTECPISRSGGAHRVRSLRMATSVTPTFSRAAVAPLGTTCLHPQRSESPRSDQPPPAAIRIPPQRSESPRSDQPPPAAIRIPPQRSASGRRRLRFFFLARGDGADDPAPSARWAPRRAQRRRHAGGRAGGRAATLAALAVGSRQASL